MTTRVKTIDSSLARRVATAVVLMALVLLVIFWLPETYVALFLAFVVTIASWEWSRLSGLTRTSLRGAYVLATIGLLAIVTVFEKTSWLVPTLLVAALLWWLFATLTIVRLQRGEGEFPRSPVISSLVGFVILIPAYCAALALWRLAPWTLLLLLFMIWAADSGAYFGGKAWGRHRLADRISPGKTWEGVGAGLLAVAAVSVIALVAGFDALGSVLFVVVALAVGAISVIGDLVESAYKRMQGLKDSGSLLPGHGGVLDRIDSFLAAAPLFAVGLLWGGGQ